jgi:hypothetical protein
MIFIYFEKTRERIQSIKMLRPITHMTGRQTAFISLDSVKNSYILSTMLKDTIMFKKRDANVIKLGLNNFLLKLNEVKLPALKAGACREANRPLMLMNSKFKGTLPCRRQK